MPVIKGMLMGAVLTFVVALIIGSQGSGGSFLYIHPIAIESVRFYWSWPLFIGSSAVASGIIALMT